MLEVARNLQQLNPAIGVDFVCSTSKTMVHPIGRLNQHATTKTPSASVRSIGVHKPLRKLSSRFGILLDMDGGSGNQFRFEGYSLKYAQS